MSGESHSVNISGNIAREDTWEMVVYLAWPVEGLEMVSKDRGQRGAWVTQRCAPAGAWSHGSCMELSEQAGSALTSVHGESSHCLQRGWDWGRRLHVSGGVGTLRKYSRGVRVIPTSCS